MDVGEAEPLSFSIFSLGEIDCLLWRRVAFLGRKPMFPELFICYLFFQDFIYYRNSNALGHWLKNTHIISSEKTSMQALKDSIFFPRFAVMPLISLLSQSREGQGSFRKQRERMQKSHYLSMFMEWPIKIQEGNSEPFPGEQKFSKVALA